MTKILVMSDSHGHVTAIKNAVRREKPDVVIFLGDCVPDMLEAAEDFPGLDVRCVRGNCDASPVAPDRMRTNVGGVEILAVHGHAEGVKLGLLRLSLAAEEAGCRAAFFRARRALFSRRFRIFLFSSIWVWIFVRMFFPFRKPVP